MRRLIAVVALATALIIAFAVPANSSAPRCSGNLAINVNVNGLPTGATKYATAMKLQVERPQTDTQRAMVYLKAKNVRSVVTPCYAKWRVHSFRVVLKPDGTPDRAVSSVGPWRKVSLQKVGRSTFRSKAFRHPDNKGQVEWSLRLRMKK